MALAHRLHYNMADKYGLENLETTAEKKSVLFLLLQDITLKYYSDKYIFLT